MSRDIQCVGTVLEPLSVQTLMALIARDYPRVTDDDTDSERFRD